MPDTAALLRAQLVRRGAVTELAASFAQAPLKLAKTFALADGQAGVIVMDCSPGMMAGDTYEQSWEIGPEASVKIGSQSFAKVHPSAGRPSVQRLRFCVGRGGMLEWMPEPMMLYEDAMLDSDCSLQLAEGATAALLEVVCPGRSLRGETFRYCRFDSRLEVKDAAGETICRSRQRIVPSRQPLQSPAAWGSYTHAGALWVFSDRLRPAHAEWLQDAVERIGGSGAGTGGGIPPHEAAMAAVERPFAAAAAAAGGDGFDVPPPGRVLVGAGALERHGLVAQALGNSAWEVRAVLAAAWAELRAKLLA